MDGRARRSRVRRTEGDVVAHGNGDRKMTLSWALAAGLVIATTLVSHPASAEIRMEQRDGVLYVTNVEPPTNVATSMARGRAVAQSAEPYRALISQVAERSELVESVIRVESNFDARAVSPKDACGLMQLMPATAAKLGARTSRVGSATRGTWLTATAVTLRSRLTTRAWRRSGGTEGFRRIRKRRRTWRACFGSASERGRRQVPRRECSTATRRPMATSSTPTFRSISFR